jgi:hypothetical protein
MSTQFNFPEDAKMKKINFAAVVLFLFSQTTFAVDAACEAKAAEKKLAGAAKNVILILMAELIGANEITQEDKEIHDDQADEPHEEE